MLIDKTRQGGGCVKAAKWQLRFRSRTTAREQVCFCRRRREWWKNSAGRTRTYPSGTDSPEKSTVSVPVGREEGSPSALSPDLRKVVEAWDFLPEAIRRGIVAMVKAANHQ